MAATQIVSPVVRFPQSVPSKNLITQLEIELLLSLRSRLTEIQGQVAAQEEAFRSRLEAGAPVECGCYSIELKENWRRNVAWKTVTSRLARRFKLDGAAYCARVLAATKPSRSVSLVIH